MSLASIDAQNANGVATVGMTSMSQLAPTSSIQFIYAMLQMELAQANKDQAMRKIEGIKESQAESRKITDTINLLRNTIQGVKKDGDKITNTADYAQARAIKIKDDDQQTLLNKYGIKQEGEPTKADINTMIASLESQQQNVGSDVQQEMVFINDFMGQYNSYTQGASSAISSANETLKAVARGG